MTTGSADLRFLTLDPAHFHAALVHKEMVPGIAPLIHVYAPLTNDLLAHLQHLVRFNTRSANPTRWHVTVHAGEDYLERLLDDRRGDVVVLAGRNARKLAYLERAVAAGLHVLADKPWILTPDDLPRLEAVLSAAEQRGLVAYDIMTERYEITSILQRRLVQDRAVFGDPLPGTPEQPGVVMESMHYLRSWSPASPCGGPGGSSTSASRARA